MCSTTGCNRLTKSSNDSPPGQRYRNRSCRKAAFSSGLLSAASSCSLGPMSNVFRARSPLTWQLLPSLSTSGFTVCFELNVVLVTIETDWPADLFTISSASAAANALPSVVSRWLALPRPASKPVKSTSATATGASLSSHSKLFPMDDCMCRVARRFPDSADAFPLRTSQIGLAARWIDTRYPSISSCMLPVMSAASTFFAIFITLM
mmetsp:Transcript_48287/g.105095  ORF Transcript_48287/g.105095 Transcript_48287/m.105095 type:complete len:207 (-) Transcript_48287:639-1259(-)